VEKTASDLTTAQNADNEFRSSWLLALMSHNIRLTATKSNAQEVANADLGPRNTNRGTYIVHSI